MPRTSADPILEFMHGAQGELIEFLKGLVEIESPSRNAEAVNRAADYAAALAGQLGTVTRTPLGGYGDCLRIDFNLSGAGEGAILGIGHLDTVWPLGTLARMPFRQAEGRLWGPGIFDMKSGVTYFLFAAKAIRELGMRPRKSFTLQLTPDEEVGSPASRTLTEALARQAGAVLVAEPAAGPAGCVKTGRKGGGTFRVTVAGKASHAGLDFASGASAVVEAARQIERMAAWTDLAAGVTVNPGVVHGGTGSNVVAEHAAIEVDVRVPTALQAQEIERRFKELAPIDPRCRISVEGGLRRPPMERTPAVAGFFEHAKALAAELGVDLCEASVGGGSDGNFTAALGVPTLDGLGGVGEGAHALNESIFVDRIADRAALIAKLLLTA